MTTRHIPARTQLGMALAVILCLAGAHGGAIVADEPQDRGSSSPVADRPDIYVQMARRQVDAASKLYVSNEPGKAAGALNDVATYCERARDAAIASRSHEKQTEIGVRQMIRRLHDMKHVAVREDQATIQSVTDRLERVRDALLGAMFPKPAKPAGSRP